MQLRRNSSTDTGKNLTFAAIRGSRCSCLDLSIWNDVSVIQNHWWNNGKKS